ncbi:MAG: molybdopterin molybdotransferase MoeA [Holophagaceae bacterium]|nr:molybdopterin molybdotransferase MoeA [Holophagaceae bacterium]
MTTWLDALEIILSHIKSATAIRMRIDEALGLVVAETVLSCEKLPPFDNSAMDGFAVRACDCEHASADRPVSLQILQDLPAGSVATQALLRGTAMRIMTGAKMPTGSDAVIPVEDTRPSDNFVEILCATKSKKNVRFAGEDIGLGDVAISLGEPVKPAHIGLLAALGISEVPVIPPARVAVITTGNELVEHTEKPSSGQIRDANLHSLSAQMRSWGAISVGYPRIADTREAVGSAFAQATEECDILLSTGGVSVGDYDYVKEMLDSLGAKQHFWRIAQKPGGPFGFWTLSGKPFFGVPGNPVSAMVMAELYLKPAIRQMMGHKDVRHACMTATLETGFRKSGNDGKRHFLRVNMAEIGGRWIARLSGSQGSAQLTSICAANALAMIPEDATEILPGGEVEVIMM